MAASAAGQRPASGRAEAVFYKVFFLASFVALFVCAVFPICNPDFFWHQALGREVWEKRVFVRREPLALLDPGFPEGLPWIGFEWLSELLFYVMDKISGYWGLILFKAAMACLAGILVDSSLRRGKCPAMVRALSLLLFACLTQKRWQVEPEIFSFVFLAGLWVFLDKTKDPSALGPASTLAGIFVLWANLHGGFVYGLALYGMRLFDAPGSWLRRLRAFGTSLLSALANPYGWKVYTVPVFLISRLGRLRRENIEWASPALLEGVGFKLFYLLPFLGLVALWAASRRKERVRLSDLWILALFGFWGAVSYRNISVAAVLLVPLSMRLAYQNLTGARVLLARAQGAAALAVLCGWVFLCREAKALSPGPVAWTKYPQGLTEALPRRSLYGGIYLPFRWGGYVAWALYPERRVYAYGRLDVFEERILEAQHARQDPKSWQAFLDRYGIDVVFEQQPTELLPGYWDDQKTRRRIFLQRSPFSVYFPRARWALAFWDDQGLLFVRRGILKGNEILSMRKEYKILEPNELEYLQFLESQGRLDKKLLAVEFDRHKRQAGPSRYDEGFKTLLERPIEQ